MTKARKKKKAQENPLIAIHFQFFDGKDCRAHVFLESYSVAVHTTRFFKKKESALRAAHAWIAKLQQAKPIVDKDDD